jgi:hypothetical protein
MRRPYKGNVGTIAEGFGTYGDRHAPIRLSTKVRDKARARLNRKAPWEA